MVPDQHAWVRGRLAALRAGLLETGEEERLQAHLRRCERCREDYEAFSPDEEDMHEAAAGHIPPVILGRWNLARRTLVGSERALVRRHLEECEECRQDVAFLGHEPVLETVPELESGLAPWADGAAEETAAEGGSQPAKPARTGTEAAPVGPAARRRRAAQGHEGWRQAALAGWEAFLVPAIQFGVARGGEVVAASATIGEETSAVALPLDVPARVPPEAHVVVEIDSPGNQPILRQRCQARDLAPPRFIVLMNRGQPLAPGVYRLRIRGDEPSVHDVIVEQSFELRLSA